MLNEGASSKKSFVKRIKLIKSSLRARTRLLNGIKDNLISETFEPVEMRVDRWADCGDDRLKCHRLWSMDETTLAIEEHWPVEEQLKRVNQAFDQIEQILDDLVQDTACSNHAIRDLLSTLSEDWSDSQQLEAC